MCRSERFTYSPDKKLESVLKEKLVYCTHKGENCQWIGKLAQLDSHVAVVCGFVKLNCRFCSGLVYRGAMINHMAVCPLRPSLCKYCEAHTDINRNLETKHYASCPMYPVPCTNNCESNLPRKNLKKHVEEDCPLTVVECGYKLVGCGAKLARKKMKLHEGDMKQHFSLAVVKIAELEEKNAHLEGKLAEKKDQQYKDKLLQAASYKVGESSSEESYSRRHVRKTIKSLRVTNLPDSADWQMVKGRFGQFGYVKDIQMDAFGLYTARIEFEEESSTRYCLSEKTINLRYCTLCVDPEY